MSTVNLQTDFLLWARERSNPLAKDVDIASKRFNKKFKTTPKYIIFNPSEIIEYDGEMEVVFDARIHKRHFALKATPELQKI